MKQRKKSKQDRIVWLRRSNLPQSRSIEKIKKNPSIPIKIQSKIMDETDEILQHKTLISRRHDLISQQKWISWGGRNRNRNRLPSGPPEPKPPDARAEETNETLGKYYTRERIFSGSVLRPMRRNWASTLGWVANISSRPRCLACSMGCLCTRADWR